MVALTIASHLLFFIVTVISVSLVDDADRNINDPFALYAYGEDISGLRVFAADGKHIEDRAMYFLKNQKIRHSSYG